MGFATAMETLAGCACRQLSPARSPGDAALACRPPRTPCHGAPAGRSRRPPRQLSRRQPARLHAFALATLAPTCRQAYGARNFLLVGVVFQRALLLTSALAVLIAVVWTQAEPLLLFFRQAGSRFCGPGRAPGV